MLNDPPTDAELRALGATDEEIRRNEARARRHDAVLPGAPAGWWRRDLLLALQQRQNAK
jgi:hypothetical protein